VPETIEAFAELLERHGAARDAFMVAYGLSEVSVVTSGLMPRRSSAGDPCRLGRPMPGVSVRIVDDGDRLLETGRVGHIQVRSPTKMFAGYLGSDLEAVIFAADDWLRTGDLGFLDGGELRIAAEAPAGGEVRATAPADPGADLWMTSRVA